MAAHTRRNISYKFKEKFPGLTEKIGLETEVGGFAERSVKQWELVVSQMVKVKRRNKKALYQEKSRHHLEKREAKAQTISYMANAVREQKREREGKGHWALG